MTVVAWDGANLAADKQSTAGGWMRVTTKVYAVPDGLVAFCGASVAAVAMLEWFRGGCRRNEWPAVQGDEDHTAQTLFIDWSGQAWIYENFPHPIRLENPYDAIGSGRDYALAALYLGNSAMKAVEVACAHDAGCGNGIDALNLAEERAKHLAQQHMQVEHSV